MLIFHLKIVAIVIDSGANITSAIEKFPASIQKLPCAGHRINLCVNDLFKEKKIKTVKNNINNHEQIFVKTFNAEGKFSQMEISKTEATIIEDSNNIKLILGDLISKCRHLVGSFRHSGNLKNKLQEQQILLNYETKKRLVQDVATRWNSLYDMLDSICINKSALIAMQYMPTCSIISEYIPTNSEFFLIDELCNLLKPMKELTKLLSGSMYCTI